MAADLTCLDEVAGGAAPVLRLYRWSPPALSLGRFQPESDVDLTACRGLGVEVVRRPTGGRALLHGGDLTYAVAMPRPPGTAGSVDALYRVLAAALVAGLAELGVTAALGRDRGPAGPVCFAAAQGADLRVGDRKLCGSAQVQRGGVVLQHGSVLLHRLPFDELDLLAAASGDPGHEARAETREETRARLRAKSVTLAELGAPTGPEAVASALVSGFARTLDVEFDCTVGPAVGAGSTRGARMDGGSRPRVQVVPLHP
ncbi:MAG TPA: biotin/lipoate A/B protein ligase family protein [Acidimicrobiia bacterium]|jgi:lipoate-protein ligase A